MNMMEVSATEIKNNFGKYLKLLKKEDEIIITQYGNEVARLVSKKSTHKFLADELRGVLKGEYDLDEIREERLKKYENHD